MLVMVQHDFVDHIAHRDDRLGEAPFVPRRLRAPLAFHRIGVGIVAADAELGCDHIGPNALRGEIGLVGDRRVHRDRAAVR